MDLFLEFADSLPSIKVWKTAILVFFLSCLLMPFQNTYAVRWRASLTGSHNSWIVEVTAREVSGRTYYRVNVEGGVPLPDEMLSLADTSRDFTRSSENGFGLSGNNWASAFCASDIAASLQSHLSQSAEDRRTGYSEAGAVSHHVLRPQQN
ncbi:MAG: hypothetical protein ACR2PX_19100 [Endozoicomonas sp.]|uniref:hypothetical protein n=1 Tax=Endozoicomonas sp. TaxID=1892382 RepID=UPI003D9ACA04